MSIAVSAGAALRQFGALRYGSALLSRRGYATIDTTSSDVHDDFKPKAKVEAATTDVAAQIKDQITSNQVFLYMKGVPTAPNCGFSDLAVKILNAYGVKFGSANVLADPMLRDGIKKFSNWPTIPQIFVKGEFVGGADILMGMHESGELEKVLGPILQLQQAEHKK